MEFANGLYFNEPSEATRDWNFGKVSIIPSKFIPWLKEQEVNEKGYVKLKIAKSKAGKMYIAIDDWKPSGEAKPANRASQEVAEIDPF